MTAPIGDGGRERRHGALLSAAMLLASALVLAASSWQPGDTAEGRRALYVVGPHIPPNLALDGTGREAQIIERALTAGYGEPVDVHLRVVPFGRHWVLYEQETRFDAVATVPMAMSLNGYPSQGYVQYQNGIIYELNKFDSQQMRTDPWQALADRRVVSFVAATSVIPELGDAREAFAFYTENDDQFVHSVMLLLGFVDAIVADFSIASYYTQRAARRYEQAHEERFGFVTPLCPTDFRAVFRDARDLQAFERGLEMMRKDGTLAGIQQAQDQGNVLVSVGGRRSCAGGGR